MYCPRCGKPIDNVDRFCRYCGASTKKGSPNHGTNKSVHVNINKTVPPTRKKGDVLGAIKYGYNLGLFDRLTTNDMISFALKHNKTARYDIEKTIYQIIGLYKSGICDRLTTNDRIWDALRK